MRPRNGYLAFVGLAILQPVLFVLVGALHLNTRGIAFEFVLLVALAFRSRIAWVLLIVLNAIPLLAVLAVIGGGHVQWTHVIVMVLTGVSLETALLSQAMRQYVGRTPNAPSMPIPLH
jgi:hypothetical protein